MFYNGNVISGRLNNPRLEAAYQKYSHRQRQKSVILVNLIDCALKLATMIILLLNEDAVNYSTIIVLSISLSLNLILSILPCYSRSQNIIIIIIIIIIAIIIIILSILPCYSRSQHQAVILLSFHG